MIHSIDRYREILRQYWGYDDFRGIQSEIIESIGSGRDTLGLMPTGGGKSITFQVPALAQYGTCIVITPLIALMKDQVQNLRMRGIKATAIYSGMTHQQILVALENCILGDYKFLYVSPERLETELFQTKLKHMAVSFITVDEAHCISQWGYDFRPSYLQIAEIRKLKPDAPVLALTASATPKVVEDIQQQLQFRQENVCRMSFERANLTYIVRKPEDKWQELLDTLNNTPGSIIIYTRSRQQTHDIAKALCELGHSATNYHAGLPQVEKDIRQQKWHDEEYRIMVATNAFGMGIDKANVRAVIHVEIPDSPEAYFQEAGRAGRDGNPAQAILMYQPSDCQKLLRRVPETFPEPDFIRDIYEQMCYFLQMAMGDGFGVTREFDLAKFCYQYKHFPVNTHSALLLLDKAGYIEYKEDDEIKSRLRFIITRDELYKIQETDEKQEAVTRALLRRYSGLFADEVYIDENYIAHDTGYSVNEVYHCIKSMAQRHIVLYIPRKRTTFIKFTTRRVEKDEIQLPRHIYADRMEQYVRRIKSMIEYVTCEDICHSRYLLEYFGETSTHDCGRCDVCAANSEPPISTDEEIRLCILRQLAIRGPQTIDQLDTTGYLRQDFASVLQRMMNDEEIFIDEEEKISSAKQNSKK